MVKIAIRTFPPFLGFSFLVRTLFRDVLLLEFNSCSISFSHLRLKLNILMDNNNNNHNQGNHFHWLIKLVRHTPTTSHPSRICSLIYGLSSSIYDFKSSAYCDPFPTLPRLFSSSLKCIAVMSIKFNYHV